MTNPATKPRLARLADAITYTALSRSSIYRALGSGDLKAMKIGGSLRFEYAELDRWIDAKCERTFYQSEHSPSGEIQ